MSFDIAEGVVSTRELSTDSELFSILKNEISFQSTSLNLTAACNYLPSGVGAAMQSVLSNIHCEGYPGQRYHQGQQNADAIERLAIDRARNLFGADHANVQAYRGTMANLAACVAAIGEEGTILGFACDAGGHYTTGSNVHLLGRLYKVETYTTDRVTEELDYDRLQASAVSVNPAAIVAGDTSWPGEWDWRRLRAIANQVGAALIVDASQTAGLIASGLMSNPCEWADIVTMATYKTLRGPRAGIILCTHEYAERVDRAVFPVCQDGTNVQLISGLAATLHQASTPEFREYSQQVLANSRALSDALTGKGYRLITGGTRNHACLIDLTNMSLSGNECAEVLASVNIICNANQIPHDTGSPRNPSGLRVGTAAVTSLGMQSTHMESIAEYIRKAIMYRDSEEALRLLSREIIRFRQQFNGIKLSGTAPPNSG